MFLVAILARVIYAEPVSAPGYLGNHYISLAPQLSALLACRGLLLRSSEEESAAIRLIREATDRDHTRRKERAVLRFVSKIFGRGTRRIFAAWRTMWADAAQERANVRTAERAAERVPGSRERGAPRI